jgi:hypothetical protein
LSFKVCAYAHTSFYYFLSRNTLARIVNPYGIHEWINSLPLLSCYANDISFFLVLKCEAHCELRRRIWPISVETPLRRVYINSKLYLIFFFVKKATVDEERKFYIPSALVWFIRDKEKNKKLGERRADDAYNVGRCYYIVISSLILYFLRFPSTQRSLARLADVERRGKMEKSSRCV